MGTPNSYLMAMAAELAPLVRASLQSRGITPRNAENPDCFWRKMSVRWAGTYYRKTHTIDISVRGHTIPQLRHTMAHELAHAFDPDLCTDSAVLARAEKLPHAKYIQLQWERLADQIATEVTK